MEKINTKMCRQQHGHMSLVESLSIELENESTFEMLEKWIGTNSGELTEEDKIRIDCYYHKAPEIEPDNLYGAKHTTGIEYETALEWIKEHENY